ncbi:hypothetical protein [Methanobrevibacter sp.]|uniref:hypothetical protein n=1 Tax=Methanobrevibacter sp. TaxID=66852 RepID=UPI002A749D98|nr:hypothetical protein [Methanobrevibacter sp.]MDY3096309.1 hypothetical protein [Methanobrevibacter sp.]
MENKNIIIILIAIIVVLAVVAGVMFMQPAAKEPTKVKITSDKSQYEGGKVTIQLTDLNKTPISKEVVNITITNSKGKVVVDDVVKTNSKGKAKLDLDLKKGKYNVTVTYGGNENYTGNNTTQKLTIKEEVVKAEPASSSTTSNTQVVMGEDGYYALIDGNGNFIKNLGPSKKYYPNVPNAVDYPNAGHWYVDKSK